MPDGGRISIGAPGYAPVRHGSGNPSQKSGRLRNAHPAALRQGGLSRAAGGKPVRDSSRHGHAIAGPNDGRMIVRVVSDSTRKSLSNWAGESAGTLSGVQRGEWEWCPWFSILVVAVGCAPRLPALWLSPGPYGPRHHSCGTAPEFHRRSPATRNASGLAPEVQSVPREGAWPWGANGDLEGSSPNLWVDKRGPEGRVVKPGSGREGRLQDAGPSGLPSKAGPYLSERRRR